MSESVSREVAETYINGYFKKRYKIKEEMQPNFWEAVTVLCKNKNADISSLIDEEKKYCILVGSRDRKYVYGPVSVVEDGMKTVSDLVKKIANQIVERESTPVSPCEFFLVQKQIEKISGQVLDVQAMQPKKYK